MEQPQRKPAGSTAGWFAFSSQCRIRRRTPNMTATESAGYTSCRVSELWSLLNLCNFAEAI